jgi:hypothetical protein
VEAAFACLPTRERAVLLHLRGLAYRVADEETAVSGLEETLKWGEPSYRALPASLGTPVRLGLSKKSGSRPALFVHCQTTLVHSYRSLFPDLFNYEGNRALVLREGTDAPDAAVMHCIRLAFTYRQR